MISKLGILELSVILNCMSSFIMSIDQHVSANLAIKRLIKIVIELSSFSSHIGGMLQIGRSRVRDPMRLMVFINLPNPSGLTMSWALLSI
jgi:hypothetical protein